MMPALQASLRASDAEMRPPVSRVHDPGGVELGHQLVQGHRDHDGGATATGPGQVLRLDRLEELGEGDAVTDRGGQVGVDPALRTCLCTRISYTGGAGG